MTLIFFKSLYNQTDDIIAIIFDQQPQDMSKASSVCDGGQRSVECTYCLNFLQ